MTDRLIGSEVGRYRITREIGEGGMGRVYEATQAESGALVAIKVLAERYARDASLIERFFAEARAANLIAHENICTVHDLALLGDGRPYIVMERLVGTTLRTLLEEDPPPLGGILHVMLEVLSALAAAHAAGIIHRDLKPDNIFVTERGRAKVLDFGIAKLTGANAIARTQTGVVLGTPEYMAPEHISEGTADARTDVYAVGVVLFEALAGRRPFAGASDFELMRAHVSKPAPRVRSLRPDLPAALDDLIDRALAKRPADRFSSAASMANALRHVAAKISIEEWRPIVPGGRLMSPRPPPAPLEPSAPRPATQVTVAERPRARAKPRRSRMWIGVAGALAAAGIAGGLIAMQAATDDTRVAMPQPVIDEPAPVLPIKVATSINEVTPPGPLVEYRPGPKPTVVTRPPEATSPTEVPARISFGMPYDFDWRGYLPATRYAATGRVADARLLGISLSSVDPDGRVNLINDAIATYRFGSPTLPAASCEVRVTVSKSGISIVQGAGNCATVIPDPQCSSQQIRERMRVLQAPTGRRMAKVTYGASGWHVFAGDDLPESPALDDNCKPGDKPAPTTGAVERLEVERQLTVAERDAPDLRELVGSATKLARELEVEAMLFELAVVWHGKTWDLTARYFAKKHCVLVETTKGRMTATRSKDCTETRPITKLPVCSPREVAGKLEGQARFVWTGTVWMIQIFKHPGLEITERGDDC